MIAKGNPFVLLRPADRRGENNFMDEESPPYGSRTLPDISHLFFGHRLEPGVSFQISSNIAAEQVLVELLSPEGVEDELSAADPAYGQRHFPLFEDELEPIPTLGLRITGNTPSKVPVIPVAENGSLPVPDLRRLQRVWFDKAVDVSPIRLLTSDSLQPGSMRDIWDRVLSEGRESEVIDAMKLLENDIKSIHFLTSNAHRNTSGGVLVGLCENGRRLPLGSFGDGMRRLLALSLSLVRTAGGFLLIDEIDTGLHFSVMEEMWKLVVKTAKRSNIQVFATTHSYDCIQGFASLLKSCPDFDSEVSIQKIDSSLDRAVNLDANKIEVAIQQGIEVR